MDSQPTPRPRGLTGQPRFIHSAVEFSRYEAVADPDECLHLPEEQCDHRTYRCARCCPHP